MKTTSSVNGKTEIKAVDYSLMMYNTVNTFAGMIFIWMIWLKDVCEIWIGTKCGREFGGESEMFWKILFWVKKDGKEK